MLRLLRTINGIFTRKYELDSRNSGLVEPGLLRKIEDLYEMSSIFLSSSTYPAGLEKNRPKF